MAVSELIVDLCHLSTAMSELLDGFCQSAIAVSELIVDHCHLSTAMSELLDGKQPDFKTIRAKTESHAGRISCRKRRRIGRQGRIER